MIGKKIIEVTPWEKRNHLKWACNTQIENDISNELIKYFFVELKE